METPKNTTNFRLCASGKSKIAAWALDIDYDERSIFPRQMFFPMAGAKDGWNKLKRDIKAELDDELMAKFHGTLRLPLRRLASSMRGCNQPARNLAINRISARRLDAIKLVFWTLYK